MAAEKLSSTMAPPASAEALLTTVRHVIAAYQQRLRLRQALRVMVSLGAIVALVWRLRHHSVTLSWLVALSVAAAAGAGVWLWRAHRRERRGVGDTALALDHALGLQARLVTAVEFSHQPKASSLYPVLLKETASVIDKASRRLPRPADRPTVALLLAALLVLLFGHSPLRSSQQPQLASRPMTPPQIPPPEPSPEGGRPAPARGLGPGEKAEGGRQNRGDESQGEKGGSGKSEGGRQNAEDRSQHAEGSKQNAEGGEHETGGKRKARPGQRARAGGEGGRKEAEDRQQAQAGDNHGGEDQQASSSPSPSPQQDATSAQGRETEKTQAAGQQQAKASQTTQSSASRHGKTDSANDRPTSRQSSALAAAASAASKSREGSRGDRASPRQSQQGSGSGALALSAASQEQLKSEIQALLKELSSELKQMQTHLEQRSDEPHPLPGTSTDPQLYDATAARLPASGSRQRLPIQLSTDDHPTNSPRRGGGTSQPSGQVKDAAPQSEAENVQLADRPAEEGGVNRPMIPSDYRPVFERLSPSSTKESP